MDRLERLRDYLPVEASEDHMQFLTAAFVGLDAMQAESVRLSLANFVELEGQPELASKIRGL